MDNGNEGVLFKGGVQGIRYLPRWQSKGIRRARNGYELLSFGEKRGSITFTSPTAR